MGVTYFSTILAIAYVIAASIRANAFVAFRGLPGTASSRVSRHMTSLNAHSIRPSSPTTAAGTALSASASAASSDAVTTIDEAKSNLRRVLKDKKGSTMDEDVMAAVEVLAGLNPTSSPGRSWSLHTGNWISIGEDFKGTTRTDDGIECSLGRLVFNIFQPVTMPVLLTSIENDIGVAPGSPGSIDAEKTEYAIVTHWVSRDGTDLKGRTAIRGSCAEDPKDAGRINVSFSTGTIEPDDGQDLEEWKKIIGKPDPETAESKGPVKWVKDKATGVMLKVMLGFEGPAEELSDEGQLSYTMKRSPSALLDVLFMDDEMRVTRGAKGAVVVTSRSGK